MYKKGFTLIELLVVIAIIGLLASIVLAGLASARQKAREATRAADIKTLKSVLELFYDENGGYPTSNGSSNGDVLVSDPVFAAQLVPKYLSRMPAILVADTDHYYGGGKTTGFTTQYGLHIYREVGGWCKTGVSLTDMATNGWWGSPPLCNF